MMTLIKNKDLNVMYEIFEKLSDFETEAGHDYSNWESLEKELDKKGEKKFLWIKFSVIFLVLLIPIELRELAVYSGTQQHASHVSVNSEQVIVPSGNDLIVEAQTIEPNNTEAPNYLKASSNVQLTKSDVPNKVIVPQTTTIDYTIIEAQEKNLNPQKALTYFELAVLKINDNDQKTILTPEVFVLENTRVVEDSNSDELNVDATAFNKEKQLNWFDLEIGVKSSFLNGISNSSEVLNTWGIGAFANLKYNMGRSFAVGFDAGITSEFKQDLNYSYLAETRTFLKRSDKFVNIKTQQVYSTKFLLSANYKWNEKFITGGGMYYNFVLQTVSAVHESGTGTYSNVGGQVVSKRGYSDLLNRNEVGFFISQTFRPNESWGITASFHKGLTNRINTTYLPNSNNTRTELSLMISKRIL